MKQPQNPAMAFRLPPEVKTKLKADSKADGRSMTNYLIKIIMEKK